MFYGTDAPNPPLHLPKAGFWSNKPSLMKDLHFWAIFALVLCPIQGSYQNPILHIHVLSPISKTFCESHKYGNYSHVI